MWEWSNEHHIARRRLRHSTHMPCVARYAYRYWIGIGDRTWLSNWNEMSRENVNSSIAIEWWVCVWQSSYSHVGSGPRDDFSGQAKTRIHINRVNCLQKEKRGNGRFRGMVCDVNDDQWIRMRYLCADKSIENNWFVVGPVKIAEP